MKIYELAQSANPKRVNIFLAEKGIADAFERIEVNIREGANLAKTYRDKVPNGQIPALALDEGTVICESVAICRYVDELYPDALNLFGATIVERAQVEMWQRMVELEGLEMAIYAFRHLTGVYADRETVVKLWGEEAKKRAIAFYQKLNRQLERQPYIAGAHYSIADITGIVFLHFMNNRLDSPCGEQYAAIGAWQDKIRARPAVSGVLA